MPEAPPYSINPARFTVPEADYVCRIILMFGAVPAALTYCYRLKMAETARYAGLVAKNAKQAAAVMSKVLQVYLMAEEVPASKTMNDSNSFGMFSKEFARCHGLHLVRTTRTWFLFDIAYYSGNFVTPTEIFPTGLRSTSPGISAAGMIISAFEFQYGAQSTDPTKTGAGYPPGIGIKDSLIMLGAINAVGYFFTFLAHESKGKSLEELTRESEEQFGEARFRSAWLERFGAVVMEIF